jgi:hypothetical protein
MSGQKFLSPAKVRLMLPVTAWKKGWPIPAQNRYAPCSKIIYVVSYHSVFFFFVNDSLFLAETNNSHL